MTELARMTLFLHDRSGQHDMVLDPDLLRALLRETPMVTRHEDGSCTLVFDMVEPEFRLTARQTVELRVNPLEWLKSCGEALAKAARDLDLPLTAALAESAKLVAEDELRTAQHMLRRAS